MTDKLCTFQTIKKNTPQAHSFNLIIRYYSHFLYDRFEQNEK